MTAIRQNGASSGSGVLATFAYDNLGRRTRITRGNGVTTTYGYDAASRLSTLSQDLAFSSQDQTESFAYNSSLQVFATGNGTSETFDGPGRLASAGPASSPTRFVYDGQAMIAELGTSGQVLRRYVHGPGVDEPLVWYEGSGTGTRYSLTADRQGSITAVTGSDGRATAINRYDEYGIPGSSNAGRFQYTGQMYMSEYGLYHYKARAYSPTLGRFMQPDPIGYGDGMHLYNYVQSDPVNGTDPTGLVVVSDNSSGGGSCGGATAVLDDGSTVSITAAACGGGGGGGGAFTEVSPLVVQARGCDAACQANRLEKLFAAQQEFANRNFFDHRPGGAANIEITKPTEFAQLSSPITMFARPPIEVIPPELMKPTVEQATKPPTWGAPPPPRPGGSPVPMPRTQLGRGVEIFRLFVDLMGRLLGAAPGPIPSRVQPRPTPILAEPWV